MYFPTTPVLTQFFFTQCAVSYLHQAFCSLKNLKNCRLKMAIITLNIYISDEVVDSKLENY